MSPKLRRRIAIALLAVLFALPLFHYNFEFVQRTYNLYGRARPTAPGVIPLITFGVSLLIALQVIGYLALAWLAVKLKEYWLGAVRLSLQLRTTLVLSVFAALILFLNTQLSPAPFGYSFGFPVTVVLNPDNPLWQTLVTSFFLTNVFCGLFTLLIVALICEYKVWPRSESVSTSLTPTLEPTALPVSPRQRLLYSIPMFVCLFGYFLAGIPAAYAVEIAALYRREQNFALMFVFNTSIVVSLMCGVILPLIYFKWICRSRRAIYIFNCILLILIFVYLFMLALGIVSLFFKIQTPIGRK
jgi:hypothetical protein